MTSDAAALPSPSKHFLNMERGSMAGQTSFYPPPPGHDQKSPAFSTLVSTATTHRVLCWLARVQTFLGPSRPPQTHPLAVHAAQMSPEVSGSGTASCDREGKAPPSLLPWPTEFCPQPIGWGSESSTQPLWCAPGQWTGRWRRSWWKKLWRSLTWKWNTLRCMPNFVSVDEVVQSSWNTTKQLF